MVSIFAFITVMVTSASADPVLRSCARGAVYVVRDNGLAEGCERIVGGKPVRVGPWLFHDSAGALVYKASYNELGREHGKAYRYAPDGAIVHELEFADGVPEGVEVTRWPGNGHLKSESSYRNGKLHGVRKRWEYDPKRKPGCTPFDERCWFGSQECWIDGERRTHGDCADFYARHAAIKRNRAPASKP